MRYLPQAAIFGRSMLMFFLIGPCLTGCNHTTERMHPQFPTYRQSMGVILVLAPEIGIFEQMPDGSRLSQDIQSQAAQLHATQSIVRELEARHFSVQTADADVMRLPEYTGITTLFRSVNRSIQLHTFGPQPYPAKLSAFEYDLGPVAEILRAHRADGLVLALGHQTGSDPPIRNWLSVAVVEPEGRIIWYGLKGDHQKYNLQRPEGMTALVAHTMANFWEQGR